jgi:hypothetical protein
MKGNVAEMQKTPRRIVGFSYVGLSGVGVSAKWLRG